MGLGAIVVLGAERETSAPEKPEHGNLLAEPLACVDVLGRSMLERDVEGFLRGGADVVTVLAPAALAGTPPLAGMSGVKIEFVSDWSTAIAQTINRYWQNGIEYSFVVSSEVYVETDLRDFFYFHREAKRWATRAFNEKGPFELWMVDCARSPQLGIERLLEKTAPTYLIGGYACRLMQPHDLRQIAADSLAGRCAMRPSGREVKPGIWIAEGAEIDRRARIVAPAYIGRGSKVRQDALITRCSNIEKDCYIDYGTVIEDSSILADTRIGICLDVCHAVANGNKFLSLKHDVVLEISDSAILRSNTPVRQESRHPLTVIHRHEEQEISADLRPETAPASKTWQFGADLIQG